MKLEMTAATVHEAIAKMQPSIRQLPCFLENEYKPQAAEQARSVRLPSSRPDHHQIGVFLRPTKIAYWSRPGPARLRRPNRILRITASLLDISIGAGKFAAWARSSKHVCLNTAESFTYKSYHLSYCSENSIRYC